MVMEVRDIKIKKRKKSQYECYTIENHYKAEFTLEEIKFHMHCLSGFCFNFCIIFHNFMVRQIDRVGIISIHAFTDFATV